MAIEDQYSLNNFKKSAQSLLPPGEYWQNQTPGTELDNFLSAVAEELKTTHDETKLSVLFELDNSLFGWKISDYQGLLNQQGIEAVVYDSIQTPNRIYIEVVNLEDLLTTFKQLESLRLPHTEITWKKRKEVFIGIYVRSLNHLRIEAVEA